MEYFAFNEEQYAKKIEAFWCRIHREINATSWKKTASNLMQW